MWQFKIINVYLQLTFFFKTKINKGADVQKCKEKSKNAIISPQDIFFILLAPTFNNNDK